MKRPIRKIRNGFVVIALGVAFLCAVLMYKKQDLLKQKAELQKELAGLEYQYQESNEKTDELIARQSYMKTIKYIEDMAREKLGMVYEDEIIFKEKKDDSK